MVEQHEAVWRAIQADHSSEQEREKVLALAKAAWHERFRQQLKEGERSRSQLDAVRDLEVEADSIESSFASSKRTNRATRLRDARRVVDCATIRTRRLQTQVARRDAKAAQRSASEAQWQSIQAQRNAPRTRARVTRLGNAPGTDGDGRVSSPSARRQSDVSNTQEKDEAAGLGASGGTGKDRRARAEAVPQQTRLYRSKQGCTAAKSGSWAAVEAEGGDKGSGQSDGGGGLSRQE